MEERESMQTEKLMGQDNEEVESSQTKKDSEQSNAAVSEDRSETPTSEESKKEKKNRMRLRKKQEMLEKKHEENEALISKEEKRKVRRIKRKRRFRWLRRCLTGIGVLAIAAFILLGIKIYPTYRSISKEAYTKLSDLDETTFLRNGNTEIYDAAGNVIGKLGNEKYVYVQGNEISDYVKNGYIAQEDKNFYTHFGVDIKATIRAAYVLFKNKGTITQGASTITMQVVKNNLLSQERTYKRKVLEMMLAIQLEKRFDKSKIMEFYCNSNYYGNGCYGIEGASRYYFGKTAKTLTLAEAAMLVGTSNSPNNYNPVVSYDKAMEKKLEVLGNMLTCGYISQEEYDEAAAEQPEIVQMSENSVEESYMMTYAMHCATMQLMEQEGFEFLYTFESQEAYDTYKTLYQASYDETYESLKTGGYQIYTSLDPDVQKELQASVDDGLSGFQEKQDGTYKLQGAAVCIDNDTQMVIAIVGGRDGEGSFNRGYQAKRQPGSAIKPLLDYGPALNEGVILPSTVIKDQEISYDGYTPTNAGGGYRGNVTVREALARSINTVAVQTYDMVTPEVGMSYLDALGFSSITYTDQNIMTTAIGGFTDGVTVADMARGYATIANGGMKSDDTCITKIVDYTGQTIYESGKQEKRVFLEDTAFILSDLLQGTFNEEYGTAHDAKTDDQVYAGKTGTTNDNKDAWFCGYSAYYTTCVWVGCDMPESVSGMYGSSYPLSIWSDFMEQMHEGKQKQDFECPATVVLASTSINNANPYKVDMETMEVAYDKDYYGNRPDGWDYAAGELIDQAIAAAEQRKQETLIAKLEKKVAKFEETVITDAKSATLVQETYTSLVESIRNVTDDETRNTLLERISYKYDLLQEEILSEWGDITKLEEEYAYLQGQEDSILSEQKSAEAADAAYEKSLTSIVEWYIMTLNERTVYTDTIDKLIDDGEDYLDMCSEFDSYADLKAKFLLAKEYAEALPEPEHADDGIPEMPDEEDYEDDVGPEEGTLP